jgi:ribosome-associated protein
MPRSKMKDVALSCARSADDKKGEDILVLDVRKSSPVADYLVIVTALSRPHLQALEDRIEETLLASGLPLHHRSRPQTDKWRVLDYGGVLVHLMQAEARELYALERLNEGAKEVPWRS